MRKPILVITTLFILCGLTLADEPPQIAQIPTYLDAVANEQFSYDVDATGDPSPTFSLSKAPSGMTIDPSTGLIEWLPGEEHGGINHVHVDAVNSAGSQMVSFSVRVTSDTYYAPVLDSIPDQTIQATEQWNYSVSAIGYPEPTFRLSGSPVLMDIDLLTGVITWKPGWNDAGNYTITVRANSSMGTDYETFSLEVLPVIHTVTLESTEGGSVTEPGEGDFTYEKNERIPIEAVADEGYRFLTWSGGDVEDRDSANTILRVDGDYTVLAMFESTTGPLYELSLTSSEGGYVKTPGEGTFSYTKGTEVSVTARNNGGYVFYNWTGTAVDAGKVSSPTSEATYVTMDANYNLQANFIRWYLVEISSNSGGMVVQPGEGFFSYNAGTSLSIRAERASGYHFVRWSGSAVDNGKVSNPNSDSTTVLIDADCSIIANFDRGDPPQQRILTISSTSGGSVTSPGEGTFKYDDGTSVSINAHVDDGYRFTGWTGSAVNADKVASPNQRSTTVTLDADYTLQATFEEIVVPPMILEISSTRGGSVSNPGEGTFHYDEREQVYLQAHADPGYKFTHWSGGVFSTTNPTYISMDTDQSIQAHFVSDLDVIYVDDDALSDPASGDPSISHPMENGSAEYPFDTIQEALEVANQYGTIHVHPGIYIENIDFQGKTVELQGGISPSSNAESFPVIDGGAIGNVLKFTHGEDPNCTVQGFVLTRGLGQSGGAVLCLGSSPTITNCLIVGNRSIDPNGAAIHCLNSQATFLNCTVADNGGQTKTVGLHAINSTITILNSIFWNNGHCEVLLDGPSEPLITYSDIAGGWLGVDNVDTDPLFAEHGYWANPIQTDLRVQPETPGAVWIDGDYHLKSQAGRWVPETQDWILDDSTSACIDAGNPLDSIILEPMPNGGVINIGAYGGTSEASRSN